MDAPDRSPSGPQPVAVRSSRSTAIAAAIVAAVAVAAVVLGLRIAGKAEAAGFLNLGGGIATDLNLVLHALLALGLTFGFYLARKGNIEAHRVNQTIWVLVNTMLVATIMLPSAVGLKLKSVADLADPGIGVSWLHALVGIFTVTSGLWLVLQMNDLLPARWHIRWWKALMRATLAGYWAMVLLGFVTYYYWYVA